MARRGPERRLATVLFVDIVGSTRVASDVGDRRWRELVRNFRRAVRAQLRAHGGREEDTAGDGFFATFSRPAGGVRAASAIVRAAQRLGVDVRCGLHTGELERIDGRLGGIGAHIGARVMAHAGPATVLVTATVHDLVVGSGIGFEPAAETELKGVPGRWVLHRVTHVDRTGEPEPLTPDAAAAILGLGDRPRRPLRALPRPAVMGAAVVAALGLVALGAAVLILPRDVPSMAGAPSAPAQRPLTMLRIDPATHRIAREVRDRYVIVDREVPVRIVDGTLWQETPINLVRRDLESGEALDVIEHPPNVWWTHYGFGSVWFQAEDDITSRRFSLHRVDPLSGRTVTRIDIEQSVRDIAFGREAIYVLTREAEILEIDPDANDFVDQDTLPIETIPDAIVSIAGSVWICECEEGRITHWDPVTDRTIRTVEFAQRGFILRDQRESSQGEVSIDAGTVWLMDGEAGTITPVDTETGAAGQPIGIPQGSLFHDFGLGSIWIGGDHEVHRLRLDTGRVESVSLPEGARASGVGVDEATAAVWVSTWLPDRP